MSEHGLPSDFRRKRVTVMGLGTFGGGLGVVSFLLDRGADVTVTDLQTSEALTAPLKLLSRYRTDAGQGVGRLTFRLGGHDERDFRDADLIVVNPAVPKKNPFLETARRHRVPLTSEMALFWHFNPGRVIAVTGSNGKSTTAAMIHAILTAFYSPGGKLSEDGDPAASPDQTAATRDSGPPPDGRRPRCWLGGNIGAAAGANVSDTPSAGPYGSLTGSLLPSIGTIRPEDWIVLELSSFQLEDLNGFRVVPDVAVVTNFSPNHLDRHGTLDDYRRAKQTVLRWQTPQQVAVVNGDDRDVREWPGAGRRLQFALRDPGSDGVFQVGTETVVRFAERRQRLPLRHWLRVPGRHNLTNAMAATCVAKTVGVDDESVCRGLKNFFGLPHRLQFVAEIDGRQFYNDSLATTPESVWAALEAFSRPVVLMAGGYDKQVSLDDLVQAICRRTKAVALMGQTADRLALQIQHAAPSKAAAAPAWQTCDSLREALQWAVAQSSKGDVILLSPGCASFDWFQNFKDRGEQFITQVQALACVGVGFP